MIGSLPFREATEALRRIEPEGAELAIVLGSGLDDAAGLIRDAEQVPVASLPGYPRSGVAGHAGMISFSRVGGLRLIVFRGRTHYYERGLVREILAPVQVARGLGARVLLLTNAAGGIRRSFHPGDLMVIEDHLNFTFKSLPRSEKKDTRRTPSIYDPELIEITRDVSSGLGIFLHQGVYAGVLGPSYESAAEISMLLRAGADAVGMSTVLEAQEAARLGMRVAGLSLITNRATGTGVSPLRHDEVTAVGEKASANVARLVRGIVESVGGRPFVNK